jgi:hypothetical protein
MYLVPVVAEAVVFLRLTAWLRPLSVSGRIFYRFLEFYAAPMLAQSEADNWLSGPGTTSRL